jgi:hypothetical protein
MHAAAFERPGSWRRIPGLLLASIALAGQLALGAIVPTDGPMQGTLSGLESLGVICHSPGPGDPDQPSTPDHRTPDCAICPLCVALAAPAMVVLVPAPVLPAPTIVLAARSSGPVQARAPPSEPLRTARPRGPPILA